MPSKKLNSFNSQVAGEKEKDREGHTLARPDHLFHQLHKYIYILVYIHIYLQMYVHTYRQGDIYTYINLVDGSEPHYFFLSLFVSLEKSFFIKLSH